MISIPYRPGTKTRGVSSRSGFCNPEGLQAQIAACDLWQILLFLLVAAMSKHSTHGIHLRMARCGTTPRRVNSFQDDRCGPQRQTRATIGFWNQGRQPARLGQGADKRLGISTLSIHLSPVFSRKIITYPTHCLPDLRKIFSQGHLLQCVSHNPTLP